MKLILILTTGFLLIGLVKGTGDPRPPPPLFSPEQPGDVDVIKIVQFVGRDIRSRVRPGMGDDQPFYLDIRSYRVLRNVVNLGGNIYLVKLQVQRQEEYVAVKIFEPTNNTGLPQLIDLRPLSHLTEPLEDFVSIMPK